MTLNYRVPLTILLLVAGTVSISRAQPATVTPPAAPAPPAAPPAAAAGGIPMSVKQSTGAPPVGLITSFIGGEIDKLTGNKDNPLEQATARENLIAGGKDSKISPVYLDVYST